MPELSGAERYTMKELVSEINSLLPQEARQNESLISFMTIAQISLNHDTLKKYSITEEQIINKILSIKVNQKPFFKGIYKTDLK